MDLARRLLRVTSGEMRRTIARKRDGAALDAAEWAEIVSGALDGDIDEAQIAALLMACFLRGLDRAETEALTRAFVASGTSLEAPLPNCVDKHSSGGVGDTTSLVVVPLVAACGVPVAKLSGRALGHTGGTLDKLEAIDGLRTDLAPAVFAEQVRSVGCAIAAQSADLVPGDKYFYALRDRTSTIESLGLLASSIVSKKIAGGAPAIVYDVKCGGGAFLSALEEATALAETLVTITSAFGRRATALVSDMDEPLGSSIGTGLEVLEAVAILRGERRVPRLSELCERVALDMLQLGGVGAEEARPAIERALGDGSAYVTFERMLNAQGARAGSLERLAPHKTLLHVAAVRCGFVEAIEARVLGDVARWLVERDGPGAGLALGARVGDAIETGRLLATIYGTEDAADAVRAAFRISAEPPPPRPLVYGEIASGATRSGTARSTLETR